MTIEITATTDLDYLIDPLRVHLWDTTEPYTYSDGLLKRCLVMGVKSLMPRWNNRYIVAETTLSGWTIARNTNDTFSQASPPVIMYGDERPIILSASITLKTGKIYSQSYDTVSWRDDEVSFSNMTGGKMAEGSLLRDTTDLDALLPQRGKRLAQPSKQSLLGFRKGVNEFEG